MNEKLLKKAFQFHQSNQLNKAKQIYLKLLKIDESNFNILTLLGTVEYQLGMLDKAITLLRKSIHINNNQFIAHQNIGIVYSKKLNYDEAIFHLNYAIKINSSYYHLYNELGNIYLQKNNYQEALSFFDKALNINPNYSEALNNRGICYRRLKKIDKALKDFDKAIFHNKNYAEAYLNYANCQKDLGLFSDAEIGYKKAISFKKNYFAAKYNLSILYLYQGNFKKGWLNYGMRWHDINKPAFTKYIPTCKKINGINNLLLWGEQGIGDQIIFCSMLKELDYIEKITVAIDERLIPILKRSYKEIKFINILNIDKTNLFDFQLPLADLGSFLRKSRNSFLSQPNFFLKPNYKKSSNFIKKIASKKPICGISWKSKNLVFGQAKSLSLKELYPILKKENYTFVDLQYGDTTKEKDKMRKDFNIEIASIETLDKFNDLDGLISLINICDVVISCCNVTAHLAGALGKKTYLMVPYGLGSLWYWHGEVYSYWYPSVQLLKQRKINNWNSVIKFIEAELKYESKF